MSVFKTWSKRRARGDAAHRQGAAAPPPIQQWSPPPQQSHAWDPETSQREQMARADDAVFLEREGRHREALEIWVHIGRLDRAAALYERCGDPEQAAEAWRLAGEPARAAPLYEAAGRIQRAIQCWSEVGEAAEIARLEAEQLASIGDHEGAAARFVAAGQFEQAAEQYRLARRPDAAARMYSEAGLHLEAGRLMRSLRRHAEAATFFEQAGDWKRAGHCWARVGDRRKVAHCLAQGGHPYEAGVVCMEHGWSTVAIDMFEQVPPLSEPWVSASAKLAELYHRAGRSEDAGRKLGDALVNVAPSEQNIKLFESWIVHLERTGDRSRARDVVALLVNSGFETEMVAQRAGTLRLSGPPEPIDTPNPTASAGSMRNAATLDSEPSRRGQRPSEAGDFSRGRRHQRSTRFEIRELLGRGAFGEVYEGFDRALGVPVAIKRLSPDAAADPGARERLIEEARLVARMDHPAILKVYDIQTTEPVQIAMELIRGNTLGEVLDARGGRLPFDDVLRIAAALCSALDFAHGAHVIHRDLKPDNVMIADDGRVKLLDFGIARAIDVDRAQTLAIIGTPYYMSPEQCSFASVDPRTDVYSMGCVLFHCLAGRPPFHEGDVIRHHLHTPPPDVERVQPGLPGGVGKVLQRAMAKNPAERYRRAGALYDALSSLC